MLDAVADSRVKINLEDIGLFLHYHLPITKRYNHFIITVKNYQLPETKSYNQNDVWL